MTQIFTIILSLVIIVLLIIYYKATREYSLKYKAKIRLIARIIIIFNIASLVTGAIAANNTETFKIVFIIETIIRLYITYAILKGYLRTGQSLSDKNWLMGSSYLKGKFKWSKIDWKLILIVNAVLFLWTFIVIRIGKPEINPELLQSVVQSNKWLASLNTVLVLVIFAPISEEVLYRFFAINVLLHWFGKKKISVILAILISTIIWTYLHSGIFTNNWVKYIQVLPLGLVCSYMLYKKDLEHSVLTHMIFNALSIINANFFLTSILG